MLNIKMAAIDDAETRIQGASWITTQLRRLKAAPQNSDPETQKEIDESLEKTDKLTDKILDELIK